MGCTFTLEAKVPKAKFTVAAIEEYFGGKGKQGVVLGEYRKLEFIGHARQHLRDEAAKKRWGGPIGIFQNGKFLKEL